MYNESDHPRDTTGKYTNKYSNSKPGTLPTEPQPTDKLTAEYYRKVDDSLHDMSLEDFADQRPVLIVEDAEGNRSVAQTYVEPPCSVVMPVVRYGNYYTHVPISFNFDGKPRVSQYDLHVQQGTIQDMEDAQHSYQLLTHNGQWWHKITDNRGVTRRVGANFRPLDGPKRRAQRMEATFKQLQELGYIPNNVTAEFHARERRPGDPWPATDVTYHAPKGAFYAVPANVTEIRDRANAGDERTQLLLDTLEEYSPDENEQNAFLDEEREAQFSAFRIETPLKHRLRRVNDELSTSYSIWDDNISETSGGIAAYYEED